MIKFSITYYFSFDYIPAIFLVFFIWLLYLYMPRYGKKRSANTKKADVILGFLFCIYVVLLLEVTLLDREWGASGKINLYPFWSYKEAWESGNEALRNQIINNMIAFVPLGIFLPLLYKKLRICWKVVVIGCIVSIGIEFMQFILKCGLCELDDIINNTLGTMIGYMLYIGGGYVARIKKGGKEV